MDKILKVNGVEFIPRADCRYRYNYIEIQKRIDAGLEGWDERNAWRNCVQQDLWFIVYFFLTPPGGELIANHPFVVDACREIQDGPKDATLDLWAREHLKSSCITLAENVQNLLNNPEKRIGIFSYSREIGRAFTRQMRDLLEQSEFLKWLFPDVLYENPSKDAPMWRDDAFTVRRKGAYKEASVEAWGLTEGMPTSKHFTDRTYDDVETQDLVNTPELINKITSNFFLSHNLGTMHGVHRVVGTHYHHEGLLNKLRNLVDENTGKLVYHSRIKPATVDGTPNGAPVFLPPERLAILRGNKRHFHCQQLLDPTPQGEQELDSSHLKIISKDQLPHKIFKFMSVDPAGENIKRKDREDSWAMMVLGVSPVLDDLGASQVCIMDLIIEPMTLSDAMKEVVAMYMRNGRILKLGVEKVSMQTMEIHIQNALKARGRHLSVEAENLELLRPAGRKKEERIAMALQWPLLNGSISILDSVPIPYRERLITELDKFPYFHDDALDALAYGYDMMKGFPFHKQIHVEKVKKDPYDEAYEQSRASKARGWMTA